MGIWLYTYVQCALGEDYLIWLTMQMFFETKSFKQIISISIRF